MCRQGSRTRTGSRSPTGRPRRTRQCTSLSCADRRGVRARCAVGRRPARCSPLDSKALPVVPSLGNDYHLAAHLPAQLLQPVATTHTALSPPGKDSRASSHPPTQHLAAAGQERSPDREDGRYGPRRRSPGMGQARVERVGARAFRRRRRRSSTFHRGGLDPASRRSRVHRQGFPATRFSEAGRPLDGDERMTDSTSRLCDELAVFSDLGTDPPRAMRHDDRPARNNDWSRQDARTHSFTSSAEGKSWRQTRRTPRFGTCIHRWSRESAATTAEREWGYAAPEPILRVPGMEQSAVAGRGDRREYVFV